VEGKIMSFKIWESKIKKETQVNYHIEGQNGRFSFNEKYALQKKLCVLEKTLELAGENPKFFKEVVELYDIIYSKEIFKTRQICRSVSCKEMTKNTLESLFI
jgi:hypothetical protein